MFYSQATGQEIETAILFHHVLVLPTPHEVECGSNGKIQPNFKICLSGVLHLSGTILPRKLILTFGFHSISLTEYFAYVCCEQFIPARMWDRGFIL